MTILIKDMEMPKNCDDCFLGDYYCEKCEHEDGYHMVGGRPYHCPLIEVPTPHGRLIDFDTLPATRVEWEDVENAPTVIEAEK